MVLGPGAKGKPHRLGEVAADEPPFDDDRDDEGEGEPEGEAPRASLFSYLTRRADDGDVQH